MTIKSQCYFWIVLLAVFIITLAACAPTITSAPIETPIPTAIFTFVPPTIIPATVMPTQAPPPIFTPDAIQVERWQEYQTELAKVVLSFRKDLGNDPAIYKDALCEWDILGQSGLEVYVYAACIIAKGNGDMRSLAIIYLEPDGSIRQVKLPEPKETISFELDYDPFPLDVQGKFCYYFEFPSAFCPLSTYPLPRLDVLYMHLKYRQTHPEELPLVVLSTIPTATPTSVTIIPTPPVIFMITPDEIQVKRWIEYQTALAQKMFPPAIRAQGKVLCEWEILGQTDQEVYVWAVCMVLPVEDSYPPILNVMSSIFHLDSDGIIQNIEVPDDNNYLGDFKQIFPGKVYIDSSMAANEERLTSHLRWRFLHPEDPPLIVLSAIIPTATPKP